MRWMAIWPRASYALLVVPLERIAEIEVGNHVTCIDFVHVPNLSALVALGGLLSAPPRAAMSLVAAAAVLLGLILGYRSGNDCPCISPRARNSTLPTALNPFW